MTEKITREQIEEWRQEARYSHHDVMTVKFTPDELLDLCTLALQAEAMQPRPIEEAPKDGRWLILYDGKSRQIGHWQDPIPRGFDADWYSPGNSRLYGDGFTHFIPLSALPEPKP